MELKDAIQNRKSERNFTKEPLTEQEMKYIHWAAYKIPSAGALYPLEMMLVKDFEIYNSDGFITLPYVYIIVADFSKTTVKYGGRGVRYVYIEAGHMAQNIQLIATELGLGSYCIGAFDDESVKKCIKTELYPIYMVAIGRKK